MIDSVEFERDAWVPILAESDLWAHKETHQIDVNTSPTSVKARNGVMEVEFQADLPYNSITGNNMVIGFSAKKMASVLGAMGPVITWFYESEAGASLFRDDDENLTAILMPVRLHD